MNAGVATAGRFRQHSRDRAMITPEGIVLPITVASRGARAGALILDLTIITILLFVTAIILISMAGGTARVFAEANNPEALGKAFQFLLVLWFIAMFLFRNAYFLYFELGPRGATPGKRMAGIRIAARDGGRLSAEMVIARNLLRDIELFLPLVFVMSAGDGDSGAAGIVAAVWFLIFALFPFFNRDRLRAGDIIAGSWVVETNRRKLETAMTIADEGKPAAQPHVKHYRFGDAELSIYGEYELQTLERVLRDDRAGSLDAVYTAICRKTGWTAGAGDERAFLEAFYTQLRARLESGMRMGDRKADKFDGSEE